MYPYPNNDLRPVFKVQLTSDNRYTDESGQIVYEMGPVSETTYPIPQISVDRLPHNVIQTSVYQPIYRPFQLPNPYLQNPPLSPSGISFSTSETLPQKGCKSITLRIVYFCCRKYNHFFTFAKHHANFSFSLLPHQNSTKKTSIIFILFNACGFAFSLWDNCKFT